MKHHIVKSAKLLLEDRYITVLLGSFYIAVIAVIVYVITQVHSSELQIVVHYTSFGPTNFYRDKWYYLLTFVAFLLLMAVTHTAISYKLFQRRGRELTIAFLWASFMLLFVAAALFYQILKIASLS